MTQSMSRVAKCIDNGPMEGFWGILKRERYYGKRFNSREELMAMIENYIYYYNNERYQRRFGVLTPMEKHESYLFAAWYLSNLRYTSTNAGSGNGVKWQYAGRRPGSTWRTDTEYPLLRQQREHAADPPTRRGKQLKNNQQHCCYWLQKSFNFSLSSWRVAVQKSDFLIYVETILIDKCWK